MTVQQQYFGYYHGDGFPSGTPWHFAPLAELGNSNVMLINSRHEPDDLKRMLDWLAARRCRFIISVADCFFCGGQQSILASGRRQEDWLQRWMQCRELLQPYEELLLGFYFDEPYWNGVREDDFRDVTRMIRRQYPHKKVMACLTALELAPEAFGYPIAAAGSSYYEFITDGAYDVYKKWDFFLYGYLHEKLKQLLPAGAAVWHIVWGFTNETKDSAPSALIENLLHFYAMTKADPHCAGMLVFSYASGDAGDWGSGMDRMLDPEHRLYDAALRSLHVQVGKAVINGGSDDLFISSADFSSDKHAQRGWRYEELADAAAERPEAQQRPLTYDSERNGWLNPASGTALHRYLAASGKHGEQAVRSWTAPKAGEVIVVSGSGIRLVEAAGEERAAIQIRHNSEKIWPLQSEWQEVGGGQEQCEHRLQVRVEQGDRLSFIVSALPGQYCGKLIWWDPVISFL